MIVTTVGLKIALATAAGSLAVGGVAAAATGSLPDPRSLLSDASASASASASATGSDGTDQPTTDPSGTQSPSTGPTGGSSPSASGLPSSSWTPTRGPNPLGAAAWGLCHAFGNKTWGNGATQTSATPNPAGRKPGNPSVAYANLVAAAASVGLTVDQFCTIVLAGGSPTPNSSATPTTTASPTHPHGRPNNGHGGQGNSHGHGHGHG